MVQIKKCLNAACMVLVMRVTMHIALLFTLFATREMGLTQDC